MIAGAASAMYVTESDVVIEPAQDRALVLHALFKPRYAIGQAGDFLR